ALQDRKGSARYTAGRFPWTFQHRRVAADRRRVARQPDNYGVAFRSTDSLQVVLRPVRAHLERSSISLLGHRGAAFRILVESCDGSGKILCAIRREELNRVAVEVLRDRIEARRRDWHAEHRKLHQLDW